VAERLNISRGNASMCLKELRNWEPDTASGIVRVIGGIFMWSSRCLENVLRIAVERKKREFDPALHSLRHLLSEHNLEKDKKVRDRLTQMETLLSTVNLILGRCLADEEQSKKVLGLLSTFAPKLIRPKSK